MADENKKTTTMPGPTHDALEQCRRSGTPIAVGELLFLSGNGVEPPGAVNTRLNRIFSGKTAGGGVYMVEYWPWIRHHRVEFTEGKTSRVFFVHETQCTWLPA